MLQFQPLGAIMLTPLKPLGKVSVIETVSVVTETISRLQPLMLPPSESGKVSLTCKRQRPLGSLLDHGRMALRGRTA